jgi:quinoprotein glucose dehydrogenase
MKSTMKFLSAATFTCLLFSPADSADISAASLEWPHYGHDVENTRYSPLAQITPDNVGRLQKVWTYHMRPTAADTPASGDKKSTPAQHIPFIESENTPIVVGGVMYVSTPYKRVVALDAGTGREIWVYDLPNGDSPATRGVEYWPGEGGEGPRIIVATRAGRLIELDSKTGNPASGFGSNGILNLRTPEVMNGYPGAPYGFSSPPLIYMNLIITGSRVQEAPGHGAAGDARAWDVRTGKLVWTFHSVPRTGELGHDTWEGDGWKARSGVNVWTVPVADTERGIVYLPFGAPAVDRWGGDRHGENLFANSIVAVSAETGKYLWHFQAVHHDIWDLDLPSAMLLDVTQGGRKIPAIAVMDKMALLFVLDRVTGKPIFPVKEVPVPTETDVPGEKPWPTQPMSVTPPLGRVAWESGDIATAPSQLRAYCEKLVKDNNVVPSKMFQPLRADSAIASFPGRGATQWSGATYDPGRGLYIVNTANLATIMKLVARPDGTWGPSGSYFWNPKTTEPCQQPPWGNLTAVDVNTGKIKWKVTLGVSDDLPAGHQNTGRWNMGNLVTTAGGLVFIGATDDNRFRAFDTATGKTIWSVKLNAAANSGPVSYQAPDGRQYVAVVATGGGGGAIPAISDEIVAFALPN